MQKIIYCDNNRIISHGQYVHNDIVIRKWGVGMSRVICSFMTIIMACILMVCSGCSEFKENEVKSVVENTVEIYLHNDWERIDKIDYIFDYRGDIRFWFNPATKKELKERVSEERLRAAHPANNVFANMNAEQQAEIFNLGIEIQKKLNYKINKIEIEDNVAYVSMNIERIRGDKIRENIKDYIQKNMKGKKGTKNYTKLLADVGYNAYIENLNNPPIESVELNIQIKKIKRDDDVKQYLMPDMVERQLSYDNASFADMYHFIV